MKNVIPLPLFLKKGLSVARALQELGPRQVFAYGKYKTSLRLGILERRVRAAMNSAARHPGHLVHDLLPLPDQQAVLTCLGSEGLEKLLAEADEIYEGRVRLFGGAAIPLHLDLPGARQSWTHYEDTAWLEEVGDIKFLWEPARFGWAVILARAYHVQPDPRYAEAFWRWTEAFSVANPPGTGPHWTSAQEVSLRLICLVFAWQIFARSPSTTLERGTWLAGWIACHAARIPPSLDYARAQNNNHLLSEAAGLYTAGLALPHHPRASRWLKSGWRLLSEGLVAQIDQDGAYSQHSTNYQRLMLQLALWCNALASRHGKRFSQGVTSRLDAATRWMVALLDSTSGQVPNLGPNDGAYILPLSTCAFKDHRPVLQAAGIAFSDGEICGRGPWDEMSLWYGTQVLKTSEHPNASKQSRIQSRAILRRATGNTWAYIRAAHFTGRPGHADQLHMDLWHNGANLSLDAGTYLYNAPPPWDNRLAEAFVHNTITLDGQDQMERAGRFLYLQRAQAEITEYLSQPRQDWERLVARHNGYRRVGMLHVRTVERLRQQWLVHDQILPDRGQDDLSSTARLHWLLPDLTWDLSESDPGILLRMEIAGRYFSVRLSTNVKPATFLLVRAGKRLAGSGEVQPTWGWFSPTYGTKQPALSLSLSARGTLPIEFTTAWDLGEG